MRLSDQVTIQTYQFAATSRSQVFSIAAPSRAYLLIQNSGAEALNVQFGKPNQGDNADMVILAGDEFEWKERVPVDAIYLSTEVGTVTNGIIAEGRGT